MGAWRRLGKAIGARMPFIVPLCVTAGVLFPGVFGPIETVVPFLFAFMTFQGSLNNTFRQLAETVRHPLPLLVILGVTLVFMPVVAFGMASILFAGDTQIITGVLLEYSVPIGIVSFMWVGMFSGNTALGLSAILVSTVLSPFSIPFTLSVLMGATIQMDTIGMMVNMVFMIALPALAGMAVNDLSRGWGHEKLSPVIDPLCKVLLVVIITANSTELSEYVLNMTWEWAGVALFILLFASTGFLWGMIAARLLNQPFSTLVTMGFDCGLRNISSGAVIATQYFPGEAVFPVMCGTIFQQLLAAIFGRIMTRLTERERAAEVKLVRRGWASAKGHGPSSRA